MKPILLQTNRLILRRTLDNDGDSLYQNYMGDPECSRFLTRQPHAQIDETVRVLKNWCDVPWKKESNKFAWVF